MFWPEALQGHSRDCFKVFEMAAACQKPSTLGLTTDLEQDALVDKAIATFTSVFIFKHFPWVLASSLLFACVIANFLLPGAAGLLMKSWALADSYLFATLSIKVEIYLSVLNPYLSPQPTHNSTWSWFPYSSLVTEILSRKLDVNF